MPPNPHRRSAPSDKTPTLIPIRYPRLSHWGSMKRHAMNAQLNLGLAMNESATGSFLRAAVAVGVPVIAAFSSASLAQQAQTLPPTQTAV